jgi:hypothetical protein
MSKVFMVDHNLYEPQVFTFTGVIQNVLPINVITFEYIQGGYGIEMYKKNIKGYMAHDKLFFYDEQDAWDVCKYAQGGTKLHISPCL